MRNWFAAGGAALLAIVGVVLWRSDRAAATAPRVRAFADVTATALNSPEASLTPRRHYVATRAIAPDAPEPDARSSEDRRFARYDKDRDGRVTREEYLASRQKYFAKIDKDGDGKLSFEEYAVKSESKFDGADRDKGGALTPAEFATTAIHRRARSCPPPEAHEADA